MILPALVSLYDRRASEGDESLAPAGYSRQNISFAVVLNKNGTLHTFEPRFVETQREVTKKVKGKPVTELKSEQRHEKLLVLGASKPSGSGLNPCFLWDNAAYMLGFKPDDPKPARTRESFKAFRDRHLALASQIKDDGFKAVCKFLESWDPKDAKNHDLAELTGAFGVFRLKAEQLLVHDSPAVREWWDANRPRDDEDADAPKVPSLTTGAPALIARLHQPMIKPVFGAQSSGAAIVSFNQPAFESFAKSQGENAPVAAQDAFKYCTALNLLVGDDRHRTRIGADTYVYWADEGRGGPEAVGLMGISLNSAAVTPQLQTMWDKFRAGLPIKELDTSSTPFYILGLAPNMSRLSVRLWLVSTVSEIASRFRAHADACRIEPVPDDSDTPTVRQLVAETCPPKGGFADTDRLTPNLTSELIRAIMLGTPYPCRLFSAMLDRVRIEGVADASTRNDYRAAQFRRCAMLRAFLIRNAKMEVPVALDPNRSDTPYLLGRLFAILEHTQRNAAGINLNRTIKDSSFGAALATPAAIFPRLIKLSNHHLNKIEFAGQRTKREKELGEVLGAMTDFPRTLGLEDQGLFAIGYYHQRQFYFTAKPENSADAATASAN